MKINNSIKLISSILIFFIIFSIAISASAGCERIEEPNPLGGVVEDPEADAAFAAFMYVTGIILAGQEIRDKKAKEKAGEEVIEAVKEMTDAERDFRKDFLENYIFATDLILIESANKHVFDVWAQLKKDQDLEAQKTSETTAVQMQETNQNIEIQKPTGTITLTIDWSGVPGEMIIDFDNGAVSGSFDFADDLTVYNGSFSGTLDFDTRTITASGTDEFTMYGETSNGSISVKGELASDYKSAEGTITNFDREFPWVGTAQ